MFEFWTELSIFIPEKKNRLQTGTNVGNNTMFFNVVLSP